MRLKEEAERRGFDSIGLMLHDLYVVQGYTIDYIAKEILFVPLWSFRKLFDEYGVKVNNRGGGEHGRRLFEVTRELYEEVCRDNVQTVADRLGCDPVTLNTRVRRWYEENKDTL